MLYSNENGTSWQNWERIFILSDDCPLNEFKLNTMLWKERNLLNKKLKICVMRCGRITIFNLAFDFPLNQNSQRCHVYPVLVDFWYVNWEVSNRDFLLYWITYCKIHLFLLVSFLLVTKTNFEYSQFDGTYFEKCQKIYKTSKTKKKIRYELHRIFFLLPALKIKK